MWSACALGEASLKLQACLNVAVFVFSLTGLLLMWKFSLTCWKNAIDLLCPLHFPCFAPVVWTGSLTFPHSWMSEQWCHTSCSQRPGQQSGDWSNQTQPVGPHPACIHKTGFQTRVDLKTSKLTDFASSSFFQLSFQMISAARSLCLDSLVCDEPASASSGL